MNYYSLIASMNKAVAVNPKWDGIRNYYKFNNNLNDEVGGVTGTLNGGTSYVSGVFDQQILTDGVNGTVTFPNDSFNLTGDFTIAFNLNLPVIPATSPTIFVNADSSPVQNGWVFYLTGSTLYFAYYMSGSFGQIGLSPLVINTNYRVVVTYTESTGVHRIYLNGVLRDTSPAVGQHIYTQTTTSQLGVFAGGATYCNMKFDELAIIEAVWDLTTIQDDYNAQTQYPL